LEVVGVKPARTRAMVSIFVQLFENIGFLENKKFLTGDKGIVACQLLKQ
jgi:hypothetical protein